MYKRPEFYTAHRQSGFTLIELMIVVVIVAILAAVAFPSYTQYVTRSHRQAGKNILYRLSDRQEQYFIDNKQYAADLSTLGYPADTIGVDDAGDITAVVAGTGLTGGATSGSATLTVDAS